MVDGKVSRGRLSEFSTREFWAASLGLGGQAMGIPKGPLRWLKKWVGEDFWS
jgi:hypothetical protein